ncbi:ATP-binding cassette domain-containing protein [Marinomonas sp. THO17]|uniref:thiamine ABC transporter ATP-binding protein n=1 Tax=Marinomonas sp. THO17 TaxID=3149048 RepID=UPI00336C13A6
MLDLNLEYHWEDFHAHYQAQIETGMTTLLGGSGEGKSTLLHLIGGFLQGKGQLLFNQMSLSNLPAYDRPISTLFQSDNLFPQLTVWQNVAIGLVSSLRLTPEQQEKVYWALEQTQLIEKAKSYPQALSGGQAQRVAIARVMVRNKPILLLDEPFSALDPVLREEMLFLVKEVTESLTLTTLLVSHLPSEASLVGGKVMIIESGKVAAHDTMEVLQGRQDHVAFERYLGRANTSTKDE